MVVCLGRHSRLSGIVVGFISFEADTIPDKPE
jgi:hypothetical protein